jgi:hypothetical protein
MIHVPKPLPDELAIGHLGRLFILNGIDRPLRKAQYVNKYAPARNANSGSRRYVKTLAALSGQTVADYLFHHSCFPFYRAVHSDNWRGQEKTQLALSVIGLSATRVNPFGVSICPRCVEEDVGFWGFSYWRRSHQLPGIDWCQKHRCALIKTRRDAPVEMLPHEVLADATATTVSEKAMQNEVIFRYSEICMEFLGRNHSISTRHMVSCLQQRARDLQIRPRPGVPGFHLHDMAMQQVDGEWLLKYFPDIFSKNSSSSLSRTYTSTQIAYSTPYYALALALLYESVDEAFTDLTSTVANETARDLVKICPQKQSARESSPPAKLQHALTSFLQGTPIDSVCRAIGLKREALEDFLRATVVQGLNPNFSI